MGVIQMHETIILKHNPKPPLKENKVITEKNRDLIRKTILEELEHMDPELLEEIYDFISKALPGSSQRKLDKAMGEPVPHDFTPYEEAIMREYSEKAFGGKYSFEEIKKNTAELLAGDSAKGVAPVSLSALMTAMEEEIARLDAGTASLSPDSGQELDEPEPAEPSDQGDTMAKIIELINQLDPAERETLHKKLPGLGANPYTGTIQEKRDFIASLLTEAVMKNIGKR